MNPEISTLRPGWKSILSSVLAIALLMSGFFWLGYWTAERNGHAKVRVVITEPSKKAEEAKKANKAGQQASPSEETDDNQQAQQELRHWVGL